MSEAAAKQKRRDIRRAFGVQAIGAIESHATSIGDLIRAHQHEVTMRVEHIELARTEAKSATNGVDAKVDQFIDRGFLSRVNWFLTGR